ncbi:g3634 [Coccomyxa elongata]
MWTLQVHHSCTDTLAVRVFSFQERGNMEMAVGLPVDQGLQLGGLETGAPAAQPPPVTLPEASLGPPADPGPVSILKMCRNCGEKKPRTDYHRNHSKADELEDVCRPCKAQRDAARRAIRASMVPNVSQKICKKCHVEKPAEEFPRNKLTNDGLHSYCKKCKLQLDTISREKRKRQDNPSYVRVPHAATLQQEQQQQQQQEQQDGAALPEQMPVPESLLCESCKQYHPIGVFSADPAMPGVLRCNGCRAHIAAYEQQQQQEVQHIMPEQQQQHLPQARQAVEAAVPGAGVQDYAAMAAASGVNTSEPVSMHPGLAEAYQLPVPDAGAFGGMQMQQVVASTPLSSPMGAPQSAPPSAIDPEGSLTALLVDPSLHEPLQVVAQKVCHGCTVEKEAQHFMPDRRSKDGLMHYCRECCQAGNTSAAVVPRRPGRPPRAANLIPLTEKACRKCSETKPAEEFPQKKSHPDGRDDYCKACHARATAARVAARGPVKEPTVQSKQCSKCHEQKPAAEFHRDCNKPDGLRGRCRACEAQAGQVRRQSRHKTLEPTVESKVCRRCNIEKSADDFPRKKERSDGLDSYCKACNCFATAQRVQRKGPMTPTVASKVCGRCGEEKAASEFPARRFSTSDGLHTFCRTCKAATGQSGGTSPTQEAEKADMDPAASAAIQRAESAAAVEASLAAVASAAMAPSEGAPQQPVASWPSALEAEQAASAGLQQAAWSHMLAPQMGAVMGLQPGAAEQQQQQHLMQLHQLQQQALLQHMQPGQQLQAMLQQLPPEVQLPPELPQLHPEAQMQPATDIASSGQMSQEAHVSGDVQAPADAQLPSDAQLPQEAQLLPDAQQQQGLPPMQSSDRQQQQQEQPGGQQLEAQLQISGPHS